MEGRFRKKRADSKLQILRKSQIFISGLKNFPFADVNPEIKVYNGRVIAKKIRWKKAWQ